VATVLTVVTVFAAVVVVAVGAFTAGVAAIGCVFAGAPVALVAVITGLGFTAVGLGRTFVATGFFVAMAPAEVVVAATGPGDFPAAAGAAVMTAPVGAACTVAAGAAEAHGSAPGVADAGCDFFFLKREVIPETVDAAVATVEPAWPAAF